MNDAKERANALGNAAAISVRDLPTNGRRIHVQPSLPRVRLGIYMFSDPGGHPLYVGVAETSVRDRIAHQVDRSRIGKSWTLLDPPPERVLAGRNLLGNEGAVGGVSGPGYGDTGGALCDLSVRAKVR